MPKKKTIEEAKKIFSNSGWTLVATVYVSSQDPMDSICPKGHRTTKTFGNMSQGHTTCRVCSGRPEYKIEDIKIVLEKDGYQLLSDTYIDNKSNLRAICPEGHEWNFAWADFNVAKARCGECFGTHRKTIEEVSAIFKKEGYTLITENYERLGQKLQTICPEGHSYPVSLANFKWSGSRCKDCSERNSYSLESVR